MEKTVALLIPALLAAALLRALALPIRLGAKLAAHSLCGFACLWLLDIVAPFTGIYLPVNAATVLTAGFLGLPGIGVLALLAVL